MIPLYVLEEGVELPQEGTYYVVAKNGIFLRKDNLLIQATVKVDTIPFLRELPSCATLRLPKLPPKLMVRSLLFFRRVFKRYKSEAIVLVHYSLEKRTYRLHCPEQQVSSRSLHYDSADRFEGYQLVGTIHSHARMDAFHSSLDDRDERYFDGLHITVGRLDQPYFTISCSAVVNGQRFCLLPENVIVGITEVDWQPVARVAYRRRAVPEIHSIGFFDTDWLDFDGAFDMDSETPSQSFYDMALPDGEDYRHVGLPQSWLDRVQRFSFKVRTRNGTRLTQTWRKPPQKVGRIKR